MISSNSTYLLPHVTQCTFPFQHPFDWGSRIFEAHSCAPFFVCNICINRMRGIRFTHFVGWIYFSSSSYSCFFYSSPCATSDSDFCTLAIYSTKQSSHIRQRFFLKSAIGHSHIRSPRHISLVRAWLPRHRCPRSQCAAAKRSPQRQPLASVRLTCKYCFRIPLHGLFGVDAVPSFLSLHFIRSKKCAVDLEIST